VEIGGRQKRGHRHAGLLPAPARVKGRRVYDDDAVRRVDGLRFAQQAGFSLKEIKMLFHGSGSKSTLSARWQSMARKKLVELDVLAARVVRMRQALELGLQCGCVRIEDCPLSAADIPTLRTPPEKTIGGCGC
jgi:MerR family redox-sensitive transcriptional activator SoxR